MDRVQMTEKLSEKLSAKRLEHSLGVEYTAGNMAYIHGVDIEQALIAGLLHDCAKYVSNDKKIAKCEKRKIPISPCEYKNPELLHAKLSAVYAKEKYGVTDKEILSAITWHTTGKPAMTTLEKIIYIADFIEPNRAVLPEMDIIRKEAYMDLDQCLLHILQNSMHYLSKKGAALDPITKETYEYYRTLRQK
ncbi:MAG: bis(5'-nucleosyl)-tetraphosphatase (symmetrical) YqeK [Bacteroidales bacterium]|nr:bis(5'-nucleosyl)-tetraphosphatase (symmetrical) YqeK [Clostridium sp.]MCM1204702.1 bis(5'-nucleosyl)-tetraphosphatase (symmetrical) YqeK [Bacteroidales bacterium]